MSRTSTAVLLLIVSMIAIIVVGTGCYSERTTPTFLANGTDRLPNDLCNPGDTTFYCQLVDVDADQDLDAFIIIGDFSVSPPNSILKLCLNDGTGAFSEVVGRMPTGLFGSIRGCDTGDLDKDGDIDIVCVTDTGTNFILTNNGAGYFSHLPDLITADLTCRDIVLADLDLDGDLDAVIAGVGFNTVFANDGSGGYSVSHSFQQDSDDTRCICVGDVNSDGHPDRGAGYFQVDLCWVDPLCVDNAVASQGDIDGDGDLDFLLTDSGHCPKLVLNLIR